MNPLRLPNPSSASRWLLSLAIFYALALHASAEQFGDFTYTTDGTSVTITDYPEDAVGAVEIPSTIEGEPVTSIGWQAFYRCRGLTSVTIPDSVTSIGDFAFFYCTGLTSVTIPDSVTSIGWSGFGSCTGLTSVTISNSVTSIGNRAFNFCFSLPSFTVDATNPSYISLDGVLLNRAQTTLIQYPLARTGSYTIPNGVTSIEDLAFDSCRGLTSISIPDSVINIGAQAFRGCTNIAPFTIPSNVVTIGRSAFSQTSLIIADIPATVTDLGEGAFSECYQLTRITVDEANTEYSSIDGVLFNKDHTTILQYPAGSDDRYVIPSTVSTIGTNAFRGCLNLIEITIPSSVTNIQGWAFYQCFRLSQVTIPPGVTAISNWAFRFTNLERADFLGAAPTLGPDVFSNTAPGFSVSYFEGAEGFTSPTWEGYPAIALARGGDSEPKSGDVVVGFVPQVEGWQALAIAEQADGRILLGGRNPGDQFNQSVVRMKPDGSIEDSLGFATSTSGLPYEISSIAVQSDGKILIAGGYFSDSSMGRELVRLLPNGNLESEDSFRLNGSNPSEVVTGTSSEFPTFPRITGYAIQPDGKIIVVGRFQRIDGQPRNGIARLLPDGSLEAVEDFQVGNGIGEAGHFNQIYGVALQDDLRILIWGNFDTFNGQPRSGIARLRTDGTLESLAEFRIGLGSKGQILALALQDDGKIVIGGHFSRFDGQPRDNIARLMPDGSLESQAAFQIGRGTDGGINTIALQADGKILIGGLFDKVAGKTRRGIARLLSNGSPEDLGGFDVGTGTEDAIVSIMVKQDGGILVGGGFDTFADIERRNLVLLHNDEATRELIVPDPTRVRWMLGGGGPVVSQVSFEYSTDDGMNWIPLGPAVRIDGGWERSNLNLPQGGRVRATGTTRGGYLSASTGIAQQEAVFLTEEGVFTQGIRDLTAGSVTLVGAVSLPEAATAYFEYGSSPFFGFESGRLNAGGELATELALPIEGLSANTKYYYRAVAVGPGGRIEGEINTFSTQLGAPIAATGAPAAVTNDSAILVGGVNPQGLETDVYFQYGATAGLGGTTSTEVLPAGLAVVDVTASLTGLSINGTYHYRIVAKNSVGEVQGDIVEFRATPATGRTEPTAKPILSNTSATGIEQSSAIITGQVDARGGTTLVHLEYGLRNSYGSATEARGVGNGEGSADIAIPLANLRPGTTYHFRVVAINSLGTQAGPDGTFRTADLPPEVATGAARIVNTTTVEVAGTVDPIGIPARVYLDYGTSRDALNLSVAATPARVDGNQISTIAAKLYNLRQGATYFYQIRAESAGGTSRGKISSFELEALSGLVQTIPDPVPASERSGFVLVNLTPSGITNGWRFAGETRWRNSGVPATGLTTGDRALEFRPVPGYRAPAPEVITVTSGEAATIVSKNYAPDAGAARGSLRVILKPESLVSSNQAQWRFLGESAFAWRTSGTVAGNLAVGFHLIECKPIPGRRTPAPVNVEVRANLVSEAILTYFLSGEATGTPAEVLPYDLAAINSSAATVGQLRSATGSGTGFTISDRVVATAGHVVFDDSTLTFVPDLEWLFQRDADVHEPVPQAAKGVHLMTGYAARRALEKTPGTASPQSQSLDVAAVYFNEDIGRGAQSGYLASDLAVNEYLTSTNLKTLVGYPVEAVPTADRGRLHATPPRAVSFTAAGDRTYATRDLLGVGGLSGAPLCVARENGIYYPAGIYLGGDGQAVVRSIDSAVTELFRQARISATGGGNDTGGGITLSTVVSFGDDEAAPGAVKIIIEPAAARDAGAAWALGAEGFIRTSGNQRNGLDGGVYDLKLKDVPGFLSPTAQIMEVSNNQLTTIIFTYAPLLNAKETWRLANFGSAENTGPGADAADPDADGASNLEEYVAGTDPNDPSDYLRILTGNKPDATTYIATVVGKSDRTYRLAKYSIEARSWQTITSQGPLAADAVIELEDFGASSKQGIYRVEVAFDSGE